MHPNKENTIKNEAKDINRELWNTEFAPKKKRIMTKLILRSATFVIGIIFLLVTASRDAEGYLVIDAGGSLALIGFCIMAIPYIPLIYRILFKGAKEVLSDFSFSYTESSNGGSSDFGGNFIAMLLVKLFTIIFRAIVAFVVVLVLILLTPIFVIYYIYMLSKLNRSYRLALTNE